MKELPDENTLLELLEMAKNAAEKAESMSELATQINEKWRDKIKRRHDVVSQKQ